MATFEDGELRSGYLRSERFAVGQRGNAVVATGSHERRDVERPEPVERVVPSASLELPTQTECRVDPGGRLAIFGAADERNDGAPQLLVLAGSRVGHVDQPGKALFRRSVYSS